MRPKATNPYMIVMPSSGGVSLPDCGILALTDCQALALVVILHTILQAAKIASGCVMVDTIERGCRVAFIITTSSDKKKALYKRPDPQTMLSFMLRRAFFSYCRDNTPCRRSGFYGTLKNNAEMLMATRARNPGRSPRGGGEDVD